MNLTGLESAIAPLDLRSCLIQRDGRMLFEHYRHERIPAELAKVNSCTKSFLSALICIAMDRGIVPEANAPISEFFPKVLQDPDPRKRNITLEHLLTMTPGFAWTEFGGRKSFPLMTRSEHWVDFVLEQPLSDEPGSRMAYSSGASQLLAAVLARTTGTTVARFAEEALFGPLDIADYRWESDPQGVHTGGYGLWLRPADLLALGRLYLNEGRLGSGQLVSKERAVRSVQPAVPATAPNTGYYAWHWWADTFCGNAIGSREEAAPSLPSFDYFYARGYAGQFVYVVPSLDVVVVLTDDKRKKDRIPGNAFRDLIAPLLLE